MVYRMCSSDTVERPCGQLSPAEQAVSSQTGDQAIHPPASDSGPPDHADDYHASSDQIINDKYISDRDLPERRRSNSHRPNAAIRTVACAAFYVVLSAAFHAVVRSAF